MVREVTRVVANDILQEECVWKVRDGKGRSLPGSARRDQLSRLSRKSRCVRKPFSAESLQQKQVVKHIKALEIDNELSERSTGTDNVVGNLGEHSPTAVLQEESPPPMG